MGLPLISSPTVDLIKWLGLASLGALLALSFYLANPGVFYWRVLLAVALTGAAVAMGIRAYVRPPYCLNCKRSLDPKARTCPHCATREV